jgi:hypothetical protein
MRVLMPRRHRIPLRRTLTLILPLVLGVCGCDVSRPAAVGDGGGIDTPSDGPPIRRDLERPPVDLQNPVDFKASGNPIGTPCSAEFSPDEIRSLQHDTDAIVMVRGSTVCKSGICLWQNQSDRSGYQPQCTGTCTADDDCPSGTAWCPGGYMCIPPLVLGDYRCIAMCICRLDITADNVRFVRGVCSP